MGVITKFYEAFANRDAETMVALYSNDVIFEDPAFGVLKGEHAKNMWRMLLDAPKSSDFKIVASNITEDWESGTAHWEAFYNFGKQNRKVHNKIDASFTLKDGKIVQHIDSFDVYRWSKQAFGTTGVLLGWTPYFKNKLRKHVLKSLSTFESKQV
ncbi:nuclear transport factor 2 family protein [Patiriisocius hiemis]|uniref:Nuclear transport factor 2 family protein n=1 Tax=Patiriisocius hiemis TaxID=3075604 RepID=A0ABU2Y9X7_9FLAO|nr:nuclear transport factor 2 family protein [Constantimarinum sp. W242]MDT0554595.1 nuclear transport factor 2 family protein [Constantimarinum sp. W242]